MELTFEHWLGGVRLSLVWYLLILLAFSTRTNNTWVKITFPIIPLVFVFSIMTPQTPHTPCIVIRTFALLQTAEVVQLCTLNKCIRQTTTGICLSLTCTLCWFYSRESSFPFTNLCRWKNLLLGQVFQTVRMSPSNMTPTLKHPPGISSKNLFNRLLGTWIAIMPYHLYVATFIFSLSVTFPSKNAFNWFPSTHKQIIILWISPHTLMSKPPFLLKWPLVCQTPSELTTPRCQLRKTLSSIFFMLSFSSLHISVKMSWIWGYISWTTS